MTTVTSFSLATENSGLVATLATRFLYELDLTLKSKVKQTFHLSFALLSSQKMCQIAQTKPVYPLIYTDFFP